MEEHIQASCLPKDHPDQSNLHATFPWFSNARQKNKSVKRRIFVLAGSQLPRSNASSAFVKAKDTKVAKLAHNNWYPIHPTVKKNHGAGSSIWSANGRWGVSWILMNPWCLRVCLCVHCRCQRYHTLKIQRTIRGVWVDDTHHDPRSIESGGHVSLVP